MSDTPKKPPRTRFLRNWISLAGGIIALGSLFAFLLLFAIDLVAHQRNPYMGILAYVIAPGFLALGLGLVFIGLWWQRRLERKAAPGAAAPFLVIDLSRPRHRQTLWAFIGAAVLFLLATATGSYNTYHYTESVQFCGQACHTPMKPEFTAYLNSPHARVDCVACHVGAGASAYVQSKVNGVHQLIGVITGDYDRPIKTPVKNLRPAQETCEKCHWPNRYAGNLDRTYAHYLADETNTVFNVRLSLKVGGGDSKHGPPGGIHWHMNIANKVEYIATDHQRQVIPWVRVTDSAGVVTEYRTSSFTNDPAGYTIRQMDCMDCHNRPAHHFRPPNDSVNLAMSTGQIDPSLPWVKSNAVALLIQSYATESEALEKISHSLRTLYPKTQQIDKLVAAVQDIYKQNFFPEMKADWRAYPDNIGHKNWAGCFRCHDGLHKTTTGKRMIPASDCNSCHTILAQGSGAQLTELSAKGHTFFHLDANYEDFSCINCHNGAFIKE